LNAFEAFPFFAVAVLAAAMLQVDPAVLANSSIVFISARVLHGIAYLADVAVARSLVWFVGLGTVIAILFSAIRVTT
jgi:uncharacterized MAPEG superfamily protein